MCGISGKLNFNKDKAVDEKVIREMNKALSHRGPDDEGIYVNGAIGLGHRRLSIIDLSQSGHQPMSDDTGTIWIVYNGEIYNFKELRKNLEKEGIKFRSKTDTEVIIYLYKKYGVSCLKHLRGMFSFAIWDEEKRQLFLARDRVGKKPLKYYIDKSCFIFSSELKAILKNLEVKKEPDFETIHHYLTFQYAPHPLTGFKNIKKLPPAHYVLISFTESGLPQIDIKRYWKLDYSLKLDFSEKEWQEKILENLEESVNLRMISDVPLGAFLSGGVDSSAIVGLMAKLSSQPIKTFSIGFKENKYDETGYARQIAKIFKTDHQEFFVKPDAIDILPRLAYYYEEPYADSSAIPTWYLSEFARKYVTVVLNGDGGDENFGGYTRYNVYKLFYQYYKIPRPLRKALFTLLAKIMVRIFMPGFRKEKALRFLEKIEEEPAKRYLELVSYFNEDQKNKIYTNDFKNKTANFDSFNILKEKLEDSKTNDPLDQIFYADFISYLSDDLMVKVEIASMAHSLEARSPLLDHKFLEFTARMPSWLKLKGQQNKYIFKKSLKSFLPKKILYRKKMGFGVPIEHWFRGELKDYVYDILLSKKSINRNLFKEGAVKELLDRHINSKTNYANHIWALLYLEHWFKTYF